MLAKSIKNIAQSHALGVESSCDETSIALLTLDSGTMEQRIHSQLDVHQPYGGVVPELAARDHIQQLTPLTQQLLTQHQVTPQQLAFVAYTKGPGLSGALMTGAGFAKSLAFGLQIPAIGIHHMEGHIMAAFIDTDTPPPLPFLSLLVSGGHSQLVLSRQLGQYDILGQTLDDAVGEAFDKTAKLLGLGYPGGPTVSQLAQQGDPNRFKFPRPMVDRPGLDMSYSGLKTFTLTTWEKEKHLCHTEAEQTQLKADICLAFETAVCDTLRIKTQRALQQTGAQHLVLAGGVSANQRLQATLSKLDVTLHQPSSQYCTDNAGMILQAGWMRFQHGLIDPDHSFSVLPRWDMAQLKAIV